MPLGQPGRVVSLAEGEQRLTQLLARGEAPHPQQVLLQRADEALGAAVALRRPHERRRALGAQEAELLLEVVGHVLSADSAVGADPGYSGTEVFWIIVAIRSEDETETGAGQSAGRADRPGHPARDAPAFFG